MLGSQLIILKTIKKKKKKAYFLGQSSVQACGRAGETEAGPGQVWPVRGWAWAEVKNGTHGLYIQTQCPVFPVQTKQRGDEGSFPFM